MTSLGPSSYGSGKILALISLCVLPVSCVLERDRAQQKFLKANDSAYERDKLCSLTHNIPLIHKSFTYSKWNMDEIFGLKFHLV